MEAPSAIRIESLAHGGAGVAHDDEGRAVFVRGGCPGDLLLVRVLEDRGRYLLAEVDSVLEPSAARVEAPCPYFGDCGGCQWQHVSYAEQLRAKTRIVADALERIGRIDTAIVGDAIPSPDPFGYRNKLELTIAGETRRLTLGFARIGSGVVEIEECMLLPERLRAAPRSLAGALRFLARGGDLGIERVGLRVAMNTDDVEVSLWSEPRGLPRGAVAKVLTDSILATGVTRVLFKGPLASRRVSKVEVLAGRGWWAERLAGVRFAVSSPSFFQVNTRAAETLVELVVDAAAGAEAGSVVDLYAGVGTFSVPLARAGHAVTAIEASSHALHDLRRNAESAGVEIRIEGGDAARTVAHVPAPDVVVIDPPRTGIGENLAKEIARTAIRRIVYVSCDPATLARDASTLSAQGWRLTSAVPVDMFPQTYHTETVAIFDPV